MHKLTSLVLPMMIIACAADPDADGLSNKEEADLGTDPEKADSDNDGLSDFAEVEEVGTNPTDPDSDADGFNDGEELAAGTDPNDWMSYERSTDGTWPDNSARMTSEAQGWKQGQVVPNFTGTDQFGNETSLYQFYGNVVLVDFSAGWCGPCKAVATTAEAEYRKLANEGFITIHYMVGDYQNYSVKDDKFVKQWAEAYGLTFPVIDPRIDDYAAYRAANTTGAIPFFVLLDQNLVVVQVAVGSDKIPALFRNIEQLLAD